MQCQNVQRVAKSNVKKKYNKKTEKKKSGATSAAHQRKQLTTVADVTCQGLVPHNGQAGLS